MAFFERDTCFAGFVIVRLLGVGRWAEVYEVVDPDGEHRALKVVKRGLPLLSKPQARIGQEGEAIASIEHVNVVRFHDADVEDGRAWLLLELVPGPNLRQLVRSAGGRLPVEHAVSLFRQACEGVAAAHALGILHRDLKPENILVAGGDLVKIADFGSANIGSLGVKTTASEQDLTSSLYAAPEQTLDRPTADRSDVYAMGLVLYEAIAGLNPMATGPTNAMRVVARHLTYDPPPLDTLGLDVPGDVSDLVRQAMSKAPAQRPSMREMADGLARALRRLHAPLRAVAAGLPLPNRHAALAPTEPAMPAFGARGTMRMVAFEDRGAVGGAGGLGRAGGVGGEGDRSAVPPVAPSGGGGVGSGAGSGVAEGGAVSSGVPTWRSMVAAPVAVIPAGAAGVAGEEDRGSTTVPVERAAPRVSRGPRTVAMALGGVGLVVVGGLVSVALEVGWGVFGGGGWGTAPVRTAPGASAVVTAAPSGVASGAVAVPTATASASAKAPGASPRRPVVRQRKSAF